MAESRTTTSAQLDQSIAEIERTLSKILTILQAGSGSGGGGDATTTIELTTAEIDGIADVLDAMEDRLSERQRVYLLGLFGAAAHHLQQVAGTEGSTTSDVRSLSSETRRSWVS